jgi:hypothetical protein
MNHRDTETLRRPRHCKTAYFFSVFSVSLCLCGLSSAQIDSAAWGSDHVGKPVPEYVTGDECLFCHRNDIGPAWAKNRHQLTIREPEANSPTIAALRKSSEAAAFANDVKLLLGGSRTVRYLKKSPEYGKLDLLSVACDLPDKLRMGDKPHWESTRFADRCAGCHTTGVNPQSKAFSAPGLDCYTCHGEVTLDHSKDTRLMHLSKKRGDSPRVVTSICAQCHLRTGQSKSSGLPYPNNFVAGDNLFRDFQVDLSPQALAKLNPSDRHVQENIRDVVILGKEEVTCLSCHEIHKTSTRKHRLLALGPSCLTCHNETGSKKIRKSFEVHSPNCEY